MVVHFKHSVLITTATSLFRSCGPDNYIPHTTLFGILKCLFHQLWTVFREPAQHLSHWPHFQLLQAKSYNKNRDILLLLSKSLKSFPQEGNNQSSIKIAVQSTTSKPLVFKHWVSQVHKQYKLTFISTCFFPSSHTIQNIFDLETHVNPFFLPTSSQLDGFNNNNNNNDNRHHNKY